MSGKKILNACPFCGSQAKVVMGTRFAMISCEFCGIGTMISPEKSRKMNKRKRKKKIKRANEVPNINDGKWNPIKYDEVEGWLYNLPDDEQEVLVCWKNGTITIETFRNEGEDGCWWENGDLVEEGQAWMPLPEPYKGDE